MKDKNFNFGKTITSADIVGTAYDVDILPIGKLVDGNVGVFGILLSQFKKSLQSGSLYDVNFAVTGEGESLQTTVDKTTIYASRDFKLSEIGYSFSSIGSGVTSINITVKKNGATVNAFSITSVQAIQYNILSSSAAFAKGDAISVDISVNAVTPPKGLKMYLIGETA
jgi:hypothetical protein